MKVELFVKPDQVGKPAGSDRRNGGIGERGSRLLELPALERFNVRYADMVNRNRFTVYGALTEKLRQMLDQFSPE